MTRKLDEQQKKYIDENREMVQKLIFKYFNVSGSQLVSGYFLHDAVQDATVAMCEAIIAYGDGSTKNTSLEAYLAGAIVKSVRYKIALHLKKTSREVYENESAESEFSDVRRLDDINSEIDFLETQEKTENKLCAQSILSIINKRKEAFDKKVPHAYDIFIAKAYMKMTGDEIAENFNISRRAVYRKYDCALSDLRKVLAA